MIAVLGFVLPLAMWSVGVGAAAVGDEIPKDEGCSTMPLPLQLQIADWYMESQSTMTVRKCESKRFWGDMQHADCRRNTKRVDIVL